uniref:BED-type domain-containing protein n=1 Tax=Oryza brachyantha TaxID=4533 RepID=J3LQG6_ORYBR
MTSGYSSVLSSRSSHQQVRQCWQRHVRSGAVASLAYSARSGAATAVATCEVRGGGGGVSLDGIGLLRWGWRRLQIRRGRGAKPSFCLYDVFRSVGGEGIEGENATKRGLNVEMRCHLMVGLNELTGGSTVSYPWVSLVMGQITHGPNGSKSMGYKGFSPWAMKEGCTGRSQPGRQQRLSSLIFFDSSALSPPPPLLLDYKETSLHTMERAISTSGVLVDSLTVDLSLQRSHKKRARIWEHIETELIDGKEKAICKFCKLKLSSEPGQGTNHLNRHIGMYCPSIPTEERDKVLLHWKSHSSDGDQPIFDAKSCSNRQVLY